MLRSKVGGYPGVLGNRQKWTGPTIWNAPWVAGLRARASSSRTLIDTPGPGRRVVDGAGPRVRRGMASHNHGSSSWVDSSTALSRLTEEAY